MYIDLIYVLLWYTCTSYWCVHDLYMLLWLTGMSYCGVHVYLTAVFIYVLLWCTYTSYYGVHVHLTMVNVFVLLWWTCMSNWCVHVCMYIHLNTYIHTLYCIAPPWGLFRHTRILCLTAVYIYVLLWCTFTSYCGVNVCLNGVYMTSTCFCGEHVCLWCTCMPYSGVHVRLTVVYMYVLLW